MGQNASVPGMDESTAPPPIYGLVHSTKPTPFPPRAARAAMAAKAGGYRKFSLSGWRSNNACIVEPLSLVIHESHGLPPRSLNESTDVGKPNRSRPATARSKSVARASKPAAAHSSKPAASQEAVTSTVSVESKVSGGSEKSNESAKPRRANAGSWEYVPIGPKVTYPKGMTDRRSREIARLAMDVVNAPCDLMKQPDEWEIDPTNPISMADRIKLNKRPRDTQPPKSPQPGEKRVKREKSEKKPKKEKKRKEDKPAPAVPAKEGKEQGENDGNDDVFADVTTTDPSASSSSDRREKKTRDSLSSVTSSTYSAELGIPYDQLLEDIGMREDLSGSLAAPAAAAASSLLRLDDGPTYSRPASATPVFFPEEMPDDFLEEEEEENQEDEREPQQPVNRPVPLLPPSNELSQMEVRYNEHGVQYRPRLLCVRPITEETLMNDIIRSLAMDQAYVIPTRRPTANHPGHIAVYCRFEQQARVMLARGQLTVDGDDYLIEQPGAVFVRLGHGGILDERQILREIQSILGTVLSMQITPYGYVVVLPSIDKATECLRCGSIGYLTITSLRSIDPMNPLVADWPIIDRDWADQIGFSPVD